MAHVTKGEVLLELGKTEEANKEFDIAVSLGFSKSDLTKLY